jgi:hypothetical protein
VYLIESVGGPGVRLNKWEYLRKNVGPEKFYEKIAVRHINFNRTFAFTVNLEKFIEQSIGHKYELNAPKLVRTVTTGVRPEKANPDDFDNFKGYKYDQ